MLRDFRLIGARKANSEFISEKNGEFFWDR